MTARMHAELEAALEAYFRKRVRLIGGLTEKLVPVTKGMPDRLVIMPGGQLHLVELKVDGGRVSPAQQLWHMKASDKGYTVPVLTGRNDVDDWIRATVDAAGPQYRARRVRK